MLIRELANTLFSTSTLALQTLQIAHIPFTINIDINSDIIRERFTFSSKNSSRELSILSNTLFMAYHKHIEVINNILNKDIWEPVDSLQLFYSSKNRDIEGKLVNEVTDASF